MNTRSLSNLSLYLLRLLLQVNFNASVLFVLIVSVFSMAGSELFFENSEDLYGPLANNLRFVLLYLCLMQLAVYGFYQFKNNYAGVVCLGAFLLLLIASLEFYGSVNQIEIDPNYQALFLYAGLSHLLYGGLCILRKSDG
ncbi:hypothetical protein [Methylomonas rapida]|uniref:Uncharacterized protein n=1 Tax=Methylomonas rapida TaxID=2963939 RepID=A0ABY7GIJ4_9GAMM|nr:hypothetical protein [Methylomonas rapida]WAR43683.1 hypothetical protein NM686_015025 [Methylomonas rapida]